MEKENIKVWTAFAGHRDYEVIGNNATALEAALLRAFSLIRDSVSRAIGQNYLWQMMLMTGFSEAADRRASDVWKDHSFGGQRIVFPFGNDSIYHTEDPCKEGINIGATSFDPNDDLLAGFEVTILDGAQCADETIPRSAHLDQSRFLVRHCEVLVVLWDGKAPDGAGGTADAVRLALTRGIPIIWIHATTFEVRLIDPANLLDDTSLLEICGAKDQALDRLAPIIEVGDFSFVGVLAERLAFRLLPPWLHPVSKPNAEPHQEHATPKGLGHIIAHWLGFTQLAFHPHKGGDQVDREKLSFYLWQREAATVRVKMKQHHPFDYVSRWHSGYLAWRDAQARPWRIFGALRPLALWLVGVVRGRKNETRNLPPDTSTTLKEAYAVSDKIALIASSRNRIFQIGLLYVAALAVIFGVTPVFAKALVGDPLHIIKFVCVSIEAGLLVLMLGIWHLERKSERHLLWSDARRLGERMRAVNATWPLGVDALDRYAAPISTWSEFYVQTCLRQQGPPQGFLSQSRQTIALDEGKETLIKSQIGYHNSTAGRMHAIHHRIERVEMIALFSLILLLLGFIAWHLGSPPHHSEGAEIGKESKNALDLYGAFLLMMSAIIPALGAVSIALESQLEISATARRSAALLPRFEALNEEFEDALVADNKGSYSVARASEVIVSAARLLISDVDSWRNDMERRRIIRGP